MKRSRVPGTTGRTLRTLFVLPDPDQAGLTPGERLALTLRRDASISGVCVCGATAKPIRYRKGQIMQLPFEHEHDCPAADGPHLERMVKRLGSALQYRAVIAEIEVAA